MGDLAGLFFLKQLVLHDFFATQFVAAMHDGDVAGDVEQDMLSDVVVAAADDGHRLVPVEAVAGGAGRNASPGKGFFRWQAETAEAPVAMIRASQV